MNRVVILGTLSAVLLALAEVFKSGTDINWWVMLFAALISASTYLARNLQGQIATIIGAVGSALGAFYLAHPTITDVDYKAIITFLFPLVSLIIGIMIHKAPARVDSSPVQDVEDDTAGKS